MTERDRFIDPADAGETPFNSSFGDSEQDYINPTTSVPIGYPVSLAELDELRQDDYTIEEINEEIALLKMRENPSEALLSRIQHLEEKARCLHIDPNQEE